MNASAPLRVVLVEPEIPPNTGNVARLCASTGAELHLVEPLGFKMDDSTLKRAGMDYWQHCRWKNWPNFDSLRASYPESRFFFFTTKTQRVYWEVKFTPGDFLVFGRETKGLPESLLRQNEPWCVTLPMPGEGSRSLNLAVAAGIGLYEALRQIRFGT
jgi:tRNA (cytidine/uridine-2'-O-)-methyltransferase